MATPTIDAARAADRAVVVHEPARTRLPPLGPYVAGVRDKWSFIRELGNASMKAKHYDTFLGRVWLILDPLLTAGVYLVIRMVIRDKAAGQFDRNDILDHLVMGVLFFSFFKEVAVGVARSVEKNARFILNTSFPVGTFPIAVTYEAAITFTMTFASYLAVHAFLRQPWSLWILLSPAFFVLFTLLGLGIGLYLAPWYTRVRDLQVFVPHFFRLWFFASPILYRTSEIPDGMEFLRFNPTYPFLGGLEQIFNGQAPSVWYLLASSAWAISAFTIGAYYFLSRERSLASRL